MSNVRITGADGIRLVGERLRMAGNDRTIVNAMAKEIRSAGKPVKKAVKANALTMMPHKGGLDQWVAKTKINVRVRRAPKTAGVDITASRKNQQGKADIKRLDKGRTRHPSFPHPPFKVQWFQQDVTPGYVTKAVEGPGVDEFRDACDRAIRKATERLV